ncbi:hypothetical protein D3C87_1968390 [compost metagenome]
MQRHHRFIGNIRIEARDAHIIANQTVILRMIVRQIVDQEIENFLLCLLRTRLGAQHKLAMLRHQIAFQQYLFC